MPVKEDPGRALGGVLGQQGELAVGTSSGHSYLTFFYLNSWSLPVLSPLPGILLSSATSYPSLRSQPGKGLLQGLPEPPPGACPCIPPCPVRPIAALTTISINPGDCPPAPLVCVVKDSTGSSIHPLIHLSMHPCIHPSTQPLIHLPIYPPTHVHPSTHLPILYSTYPPIYPLIHHPSTQPSIHPITI